MTTGYLTYCLSKKEESLAECERKELTTARYRLNSAGVLTPKFDKRYKRGEDNLLIKNNFICVLDGVGGWSEVLIDSGLMTKEMVQHIDQVHKEGKYHSLKDILD